MTSKISFPKLLKEDLKKRTWFLAVSIIVFVVIAPLLVLMLTEGQLVGRESMTPQDLEGVKNWFQCIIEFKSVLIIPVMLGAVVSGITSFAYLHSKEQTDFYHSLPVKREMWFAVSYVSSLVQVILPYIAGYAIIFIIGNVKGLVRPGMFGKSPYIVSVVILFYLLIYSVTVLAMMITGKIVVAILGTAVFLFYGGAVGMLKNYIVMQVFSTHVAWDSSSGFFSDLFGKAGWFSPVLAYIKFTMKYANGRGTAKIIMLAAVGVLVLTALSLVLYRIRPSESAGKAIVFPKLEPVIKVIIGITAGVFFGAIVSNGEWTVIGNAGWMFGVGILTVVIVCSVIEFIYHMDMKLILKKKLSMVMAVIGTVIILAIIKYDLVGYDTYLPKKEQLEALAIDPEGVRGSWGGYMSDYGKDYEKWMESLKVEDFDLLYELAQSGVENAELEYEELWDDEDNEQMPEDITVAYYLKDGKTVYRKYCVDARLVSRCMENLVEDSNYREKLFEIDKLDARKISNEKIYNFKHQEIFMKLTEEQKEKLIETYRKDVKKQPADTFKKREVVGEIEFEFQGTDYYNSCFTGKIYKKYVETIALLEEYGYKVDEKIKVEEVRKMKIIDYTKEPANGDGSNIVEREITDSNEMQEIIDRLSYEENDKTDPNYGVEISFEWEDYAIYHLLKK